MSDPILDPEAIENLKMINPDDGGEFLRELIDIFLADTPERLKEIDASLATGNAVDLTRAAHSIKGSASNFGAMQLAGISRDIEQLGKAANLDAVRAQLPALHAAFARLLPELQKARGA